MKAIYLVEGLSIVFLGPARSPVDVSVLNYAFSFDSPSNCACIFYFKLRLLLEGMEKIIVSLLKEDI